MSRWVAAAAVAALALAGCQSSGQGEPGRRSPSTASSTTTTQVRLQPAVRYQPLPGEPEPGAKQAAADAVQALTSYEASSDPAPAVGAALGRLGAPIGLVDQTRPLLGAGASSMGDIVYPQLGGLTSRSASVMVIVRQRLLEGGDERTVVRSIDVRLARAGENWAVTSVESAGGDEVVPGPATSAAAAAVLADGNLEMADSARWDIAAGRIDERILTLLSKLGTDHRLGITVLATGHPHNVFASESVSNHTEGRAVDIWSVDGRAVVEQRELEGPLADLARSLLAGGVTELGGPWDLDGPGGASFTNVVHQDHLHVGFDR
ncbi:MAG: hypothetical protein ACR2KK_01915 [Acidimicrobiales bacterium]